MIGFLNGKVLEVDKESLIVEVNGLGYEVKTHSRILQTYAPQDSISVFIYTHVRETEISLFGFENKQEKNFFLELIKVNGIGPKVAMASLSVAKIEEVLSWVDTGDWKSLTALPKVGKKTAEQIILSLKGKMKALTEGMGGFTPGLSGTPLGDNLSETHSMIHSKVHQALLNMGFRSDEIRSVIEASDKSLSFEEQLRFCLTNLRTLRSRSQQEAVL